MALKNSAEKVEFPQLNRATTFRILVGISGGTVALYGLRHRSLRGAIFTGLGLSALVGATVGLTANQLIDKVFHPQVSLQRALDVNAPIEVVFDFWKDFTHYSDFMSYVREVKVNEKYGFTWTVVGPAGIPIRWDAELTALTPHHIAWKSVPGALIMNSGNVFFRDKGNKTRIEVNLTYAPPAGFLGFEAIRILGFDPRARIDSDLLKMKSVIEEDYRKSAVNSRVIEDNPSGAA